MIKIVTSPQQHQAVSTSLKTYISLKAWTCCHFVSPIRVMIPSIHTSWIDTLYDYFRAMSIYSRND